MADNEGKSEPTDPKDKGINADAPSEVEEDWSSFSNAGFGSTDYDLWEDLATHEEPGNDTESDDEDAEFDDFPAEQLDTHLQEIPTAPAAEGLKHLVRLGTCDHCLGRVGGKKTYGQTLLESGRDVRSLVIGRDANMSEAHDDSTICPFCEELFAETELLADLIGDELRPYEFSRLQIGGQFPKVQAEAEDDLRKRYGAAGSLPLKSCLTDEIAKVLVEKLPAVKLVNEKPQILALVDMLTLGVQIEVRSHYIYGRYRKLERGIPQTRWPCRACKGRGCERCNNTGKQYETSVQDLIGEPILPLFSGDDHAFHGMGREDIDVRCMGRGRPFVIEIKNPHRRTLAASELEEKINQDSAGRIEVEAMRDSTRSEVVRIKDTPAEKSYRLRFKLLPQGTLPVPEPRPARGRKKRRRGRGRKETNAESETPTTAPIEEETQTAAVDEKSLSILKKAELVAMCEEKNLAKTGTKPILIERLLNYHQELQLDKPENVSPPLPDLDTIIATLDGLAGTVLEQRTPTRVAHRRADKVRKRSVLEVTGSSAEMVDDEIFAEVTLRCESGTYVKETIHGDGGRTTPSVAGLLSVDCEVVWLDVADIHAD
jgi:tRNA pseudouridine synthase 10